MASAIFLFRISSEIVTPLRQLSLRGYGNRRFGVTTIVASGLLPEIISVLLYSLFSLTLLSKGSNQNFYLLYYLLLL